MESVVELGFFYQASKPGGETAGDGQRHYRHVPVDWISLCRRAAHRHSGSIYLAEFQATIRGFFSPLRAADIINGVPSIVMGIFAYTLLSCRWKHFSAWPAASALGIMLIPIAVRSTEEFLRLVPMAIRGRTRFGASPVEGDCPIVSHALKGLFPGVLLDFPGWWRKQAARFSTPSGKTRFWAQGWLQSHSFAAGHDFLPMPCPPMRLAPPSWRPALVLY